MDQWRQGTDGPVEVGGQGPVDRWTSGGRGTDGPDRRVEVGGQMDQWR